jgi:hypothetical protein
MVSRAQEKLITSLFADEPSRQMARNFADMYAAAPGVGEDRVAALIQEASRANVAVLNGQITAEAALAQLGGFAGTIGILPATVNDGLRFLQDGAGLTAEAPDQPAQDPQAPPAPVQPAPASAQASPALADRAALRREIDQQEANMRAPQGSEPWLDYWRRGGDASYRGALERLQQSTDALAGLAAAAPASAPAAPQPPPAPAPAPGPAEPAPPVSPAAA